MKVRLSDTPAERLDADLVVLVVASDKLTRLRALKIAGPAALKALERGRFTGAEGTSMLLRGGGRGDRPLAIVGVGASTSTNVASRLRRPRSRRTTAARSPPRILGSSRSNVLAPA